MTRARYFKTILIPDLLGQHKIWRNDLLPIVRRIDEIVQFGNIISVNDHIKDYSDRGGPNEKLLYHIFLWRSTFEGWTQLIGPNEIMALNFPDNWTNNNSNKFLRENWLMPSKIGSFKTAGVNKGRLLTHGGLSYGEWTSIGKPQTAVEACELLNEKYNGSLYPGPCLKLDNVPNFWANPIFASPLSEVYPSWITAPEPCPFPQVHSDGGYNTYDGYQATSEVYSSLAYADNIRYTNFGSIITIKGTNFTSIYSEFPRGQVLEHIPKPSHFLIEKTPVLDSRESYFQPILDDEENVVLPERSIEGKQIDVNSHRDKILADKRRRNQIST